MTRALALAFLLAGALGCGKSTEPEWSDLTPETAIAKVTAPASATPATTESRALEDAIARSQARLLQAPGLLALMNPMAGQTDIPEAARRTARLLGECRADQLVLAGVAEALGERHPDPAKTPSAVVLQQTRAAAYRFREWALVELLNATGKTAKDLLARGTPSSAEILLAAASLDGLRYGHEGAILLKRYLAIAPEAYRRAASGERLTGVNDLFYDTRMMATAWGPAQWNDREAPEVKRLVEAYRAASTSLPGATGKLMARLVTRWWDWGTRATGEPLDAKGTADTITDLRALAKELPAAAPGLETLASQIAAGY